MTIDKKYIDNLLDWCKPEGYKLRTGTGFVGFEKKENADKFTIFIGYGIFLEYAKIEGITLKLYFGEVENILTPLCKEFNISQVESTIFCNFGDSKLADSTSLYQKFQDGSNNQSILPEIQNITNLEILPFIDKVGSVKKSADFFANKSIQEIVPYIAGAQLFAKVPLLLKLAGHSNYNSRLHEFYKGCFDRSTRNPEYMKWYNLFVKLFAEDIKGYRAS